MTSNKAPDVLFFPIHGVFKETSTTIKVKAIFNISHKKFDRSTLNDVLMSGLNLRPLLSDVLITLSTHHIGFSVDILKMLRKVLLHESE